MSVTEPGKGPSAEDAVQRAVEHAFGEDFVFRSPRLENGKEVTDVLVPWDDVAIVIEVKARESERGDSDDGASLAWATKNLGKAARQIKGAVRSLRSNRAVSMTNPRRGTIVFPAGQFNWIYGAIVLDHRSRPYDPYDIQPALRDVPIPTHVFSFRDFFNLSHFLDTPADLITYLEERSSILLPSVAVHVHNEQQLFVHWVANLEAIASSHARSHGHDLDEEVFRPYADHLRALLRGEIKGAEAGNLIDHMLARIHEQDASLGPIEAGGVLEPTAEAYLKIATELAAIPRTRRIALGRIWLENIELAASMGHDKWHATHSVSRSDCLLFLASTLPLAGRAQRREKLTYLTMLLKNYREVRQAIGIATEAGFEHGRSYDFVHIEGEPLTNSEIRALALEVFGGDSGQLMANLSPDTT